MAGMIIDEIYGQIDYYGQRAKKQKRGHLTCLGLLQNAWRRMAFKSLKNSKSI